MTATRAYLGSVGEVRLRGAGVYAITRWWWSWSVSRVEFGPFPTVEACLADVCRVRSVTLEAADFHELGSLFRKHP
jgi:hypothetical protein